MTRLLLIALLSSIGCNTATFPSRVEVIPPDGTSLEQVFARQAAADFNPVVLTFGISETGTEVLYVGDRAGVVEAWDVARWKVLRRFMAIEGVPGLLEASSDGKFLICAPSRWQTPEVAPVVKVFVANSGEQHRTFLIEDWFVSANTRVDNKSVHAIAISADSSYIAFHEGNDMTGRTHVVDLSTNREILVNPSHNGPVFFGRNSGKIQYFCGPGGLWALRGEMSAERLSGALGLEAIDPQFKRGFYNGEEILQWPTEKLVSSGGIVEIELPTGRPRRVLLQGQYRRSLTPYRHLQVSPDSHYLIAGLYSEAFLFDLASNSQIYAGAFPDNSAISSLRVSPKGSFVAACSSWGIKVWKLRP